MAATDKKFTHRLVEALKPTQARRIVWEPVAYGQGNLGLRISPVGQKTWVFQFRLDGKAKMMSLGRFPEMSVEAAHMAAAQAMQTRAHGLDPARPLLEQRKAQRASPTIDELVTDYIELYAKPTKRSADRDEALLKRNVLPHWGPRKASSIERRDVVALLDRVIARGAGVQANRTHSVLSRMFRWAVGRQMLENNPVLGYEAPVKESAGRERCLSDDELKAFVTKLPTAGMAPITRLALRFQLLTATRPGEVVGATWAEIDEKTAIWTIPGGRTKNSLTHKLPLSPQAAELLKEAKAFDRGAGYVFPSPRHEKKGPLDVSALAHGIAHNLEHFGVPPFYAHDLRRTAATGMAELGADWTVLQKVLNHKLRGETAKYVRHGYAEEMRDVLTKWGEKVAGLAADSGS